MGGRRPCSDAEAVRRGFGDPLATQRRRVLRETIDAFTHSRPVDRYRNLAAANLERWRRESAAPAKTPAIAVYPEDWGRVAQALTKSRGACFAVLNMANAFVPGGAYVEGAPAQEENMFRRTDCHFHVGPDEYDAPCDRYHPAATRLISARDGRVHLDTTLPRICIRGPEDRSRADLGYAWLADDQVFGFFELRAAAQDLRDGSRFDPDAARVRIAAQLDTLRAAGIRHAVLGAFGCGAFRNPADRVAALYREELAMRESDFDAVAFAIFAPGYGPDNFAPFAREFAVGSLAPA